MICLMAGILAVGCFAVALEAQEAPAAPAATAAAAAGKPAAEKPAAEAKTEAPAVKEEPVAAMGLPLDKVPAELQSNFSQMVHYYRIARFDLANNFAQLIVTAKPEPTVLLPMVEHKDVGYALLVEMSACDNADLAKAAQEIKKIAEEGIYIKRKDGERILAALKSLDKNERAYQLGLMELKYSGEYVAPYALALLEDKTTPTQLVVQIKRALLAIDRPVVYPLVLALETPNQGLKIMIIELLQKLGYKMALPALKAIVESNADAPVKTAAQAAIETIDRVALARPAKDLYFDLAEMLYYNKLTVVTDATRPTTDVWGWVPGSGINYRDAPTVAVNDIMATRACELGLKADPKAMELVSLWMSVEMKLRAETGKNFHNPWAPADIPTTAFFGRAIGQQYVLEVLARALRDNNVNVAHQAVQALMVVSNEHYLGAGGNAKTVSALVAGLEYPDRLVRFEAAFAIVAAEPHKTFFGADRVVPVLAEAVNLESGKGVLIIDANKDNLNRLQGEFRQAGWNVAAADNGNDGVSKARGMARIDAILIGTNVEKVDYVEAIQLLRGDPATAMVPVILLGYEAERVKFSFIKENTKYIDQVPANTAATTVIEKAQALSEKAGALVLDKAVSEKVSLRAAQALRFVATANLAFTSEAARTALLSASSGKNEELAIAAMDALAQMPDDVTQQRLAEVALTAGASKKLQIAALEAVAQTARHIGNKLQSASVTALMKRIATEKDNDIRDAVGTVIGALDLPADLASELIRDYAVEHVGAAAAAPAEAPKVEAPKAQ